MIVVLIFKDEGFTPCTWYPKVYSTWERALSSMAGNTGDGKRQSASYWSILLKTHDVWVVERPESTTKDRYFLVDVHALALSRLSASPDVRALI